jgi:hypothetical protein
MTLALPMIFLDIKCKTKATERKILKSGLTTNRLLHSQGNHQEKEEAA